MDSAQPRVVTLVLCTDGGEVLGQLRPFEARTPWWQDVEGVVGWVRNQHGVEVTILRLLDAAPLAPPGGRVTYLAELSKAQSRNLPLAPWPGVLDQHPLRLPYAIPGGPKRDLDWAASVLEEQGVRQTGPARQVRTWNLSSLWRIPVMGSNVWLKCVPPFFSHEGSILAQLQEAAVPRLLARDGPRVLMAEIPGEDQYEARLPTLLALVSILVDLQLRWIGGEAELLTVGLPDWRADCLSELVESVAHRRAADLHPADLRALRILIAGLARRFASLEECGIPDSLVHGDFAPGNARGDGSRLVLLDWGDCGLGHPLLDRAAFMDRIPAALVRQVSEHWDQRWSQALPGANPQRAAELLAPISAARQAVIYQGFLDRTEPSEHPYHAADPAAWLTRAANLVGARD